jgi:HAD superfamily hydrolase (TIGR01509 family)
MIRGIIFDCFGVLYGGSLSLLVALSPKDCQQEVVDINSQKDYGFISYQEYLDQIGEIVGKAPGEIDEIIRKKHVRNEELIEYVASLRGDYKVAMLSNIGDSVIEQLFQKEELDRLFDTVVLSHNEGLAKPNPAIFTLTAERMGLAPGECVMIDDIESNCDGAEIAGMYSVQHITNQGTRQALENLSKKSA